MRAKGNSIWLKRVGFLVLIAASTAAAASAQTTRAPAPDLEAVLTPGRTVWITDPGGREDKMRIVTVSGDVVTTTSGENLQRLRTTDIRRVRVRHADSVLNGAFIGAGAAVASGLFLCSLTEPWENCRDDVGPMLRIGAVGAGIGIGIDALIRGRRTVYEAVPRSPRVYAAPIVGRRAAGLQVSVRF